MVVRASLVVIRAGPVIFRASPVVIRAILVVVRASPVIFRASQVSVRASPVVIIASPVVLLPASSTQRCYLASAAAKCDQACSLASLDGVPFLMRDRTLRRTTDVGLVFPDRQRTDASFFNWTQIHSLNAGRWFLEVLQWHQRTAVTWRPFALLLFPLERPLLDSARPDS